MKEQVISFETAKLAKEKGFIKKTKKYYNTRIPEESEVIQMYSMSMSWNTFSDGPHTIAIVTQSLLQKWLREKHDIHIELQYSDKEEYDGYEWWFYLYPKTYGGRIKFFPGVDIPNNLDFEGALEKGLLEGLKLI